MIVKSNEKHKKGKFWFKCVVV